MRVRFILSCSYKLLFALCHQLYEEFDKTPFTLVETTEQLHELSQRLSAVTEFAVDLEVHCVKSIEVSCHKTWNAAGHATVMAILVYFCFFTTSLVLLYVRKVHCVILRSPSRKIT